MYNAAQLRKYIISLKDSGWLEDNMAIRGIAYIDSIAKAELPLPTNIAPGPDNSIGFTWHNDRHYLDVGFTNDGQCEYFYEPLDHQASEAEMWLLDDAAVDLPAEALPYLRLFGAST